MVGSFLAESQSSNRCATRPRPVVAPFLQHGVMRDCIASVNARLAAHQRANTRLCARPALRLARTCSSAEPVLCLIRGQLRREGQVMDELNRRAFELDSRGGSGMMLFIAGAVVGAAAALILAPATGRDTRAFISRRGRNLPTTWRSAARSCGTSTATASRARCAAATTRPRARRPTPSTAPPTPASRCKAGPSTVRGRTRAPATPRGV